MEDIINLSASNNIKVYRGADSIKNIYEQMLQDKQEILAVIQPSNVNAELFDWLTNNFVQRRVSHQIPVRSIVASGNWSHEYQKLNQEELRDTYMIPNALFPMQHEFDIFGSKISIISYSNSSDPYGILIEDEAIALSLRAWFELTWMGCEELVKKNS